MHTKDIFKIDIGQYLPPNFSSALACALDLMLLTKHWYNPRSSFLMWFTAKEFGASNACLYKIDFCMNKKHSNSFYINMVSLLIARTHSCVCNQFPIVIPFDFRYSLVCNWTIENDRTSVINNLNLWIDVYGEIIVDC